MTARNERKTCKELIEPALAQAGWEWEEQLRIGPGGVNLTGDSVESMYDETQAIIADYLLRYRGIPEHRSKTALPRSRYPKRRSEVASTHRHQAVWSDPLTDVRGEPSVCSTGV